ncbi:MAG: WYL domain-containing protein [Clostridia bacterium]|nr:WYL domain-containing protein [Clostridia bacterium]
MIFSELYSAYYNAVAAIVAEILDGKPDAITLTELVHKHAFHESAPAILSAIREGRWQILTPDLDTPLLSPPTMPLTTLQRRWLRSIFDDPRIRLFGLDPALLADVEPLFTAQDYYIYDRYGDGDPYTDETYIANFRTVLSAIHGGAPLRVVMRDARGVVFRFVCVPVRMEYSAKDDKFRVIVRGVKRIRTVNLARVISVERCDGVTVAGGETEAPCDEVTLALTDERETLTRCMLHFAHFEKRAEHLGENRYRVTLRYEKNDETELIIRILSFGPTLCVVSPDGFREKIRQRLRLQRHLDVRK